MSKRILSLVLTLALVLGSFSMAFADTTATTATTTADGKLTPEQKIAELQRLGFIKGDDSGDLKLQDPIKRSETAIIVSKAVVSGGDKDMTAVEAEIELSRYQSRFSDVPTSYRSNPYINVAVQKAIVNGYPDNTFRPDRDIKYSEVITMMVGILGEEPTPGVKYPDNYIGKARELGILDDIKVNYVGQAQRQGVFELLYNTLTNNKVGNYNIDKVLVLENNRVESIGANELVVEVIKEVQRSNFVNDSRNQGDKDARRGQQLRITLPADSKLDVEDLTGKVVDLSYDSSNKAVRAQVDNTYSYVTGSIVANGDKLEIGKAPNAKSYTAIMDEKFASSDERVFRTYVNDKAYTYANFAKDIKTADFAKVTIKNGKVLFVDAFNFEDIAPVKEVKKDGSEVFVYNDYRDGDVKRIDFNSSKAKVVAVKNGNFTRVGLSDISELDVVHVYGENKVIVRKDAKVDGTYNKVSQDKNGTFVTISDKDYQILDRNNQRSVYSYDSKKFFTLYPNNADKELREFKGKEVTALLDINNDVQYVGSNIEIGEFVAGVDSIAGKDARFVKSDNTKVDLTATLDTKVKLDDKDTVHQNLNNLYKQDIVYVASTEKELDKVYRLATPTQVTGNAKEITKDTDGNYKINENAISTSVQEYKVLDRTNVFYYDDGKVVATTINKLSNEKLVAGIKAHVVTDKDYDLIVGSDAKRETTKRDDVANTIVFTANPFKSETTTEKVEVVAVSASGSIFELEVKDVNGVKTTRKVEKDSKLHNTIKSEGIFKFEKRIVGAVVELNITKDDAKEITDLTVLIENDANVYEIIRTSSTSGYRRVTLQDRYGNTDEYWTNTKVAEFGNVGTSGSKLSISMDKGEINAMIVRSSSTSLKGALPGNAPVDETIFTLRDVYKVAGQIYVELSTTNSTTATPYKYYGLKTDLEIATLKGSLVKATVRDIMGEKAVSELTEVVGANKTDLRSTIASAKLVDTTGKTAASKLALTVAITDAEALVLKADATQAQVNAAKLAIEVAIAGLADEIAPGKIAALHEISPFGGIQMVKFDMPAGITTIDSATVNNAPATFFNVDANKGQVEVSSKADQVKVVINGTSYELVVTN